MAEHSTHIRHVLLYEFESDHPAAEAHRNLSQVFGTEAPSERSVRTWFQRFKPGNKKLEDEPRSATAISFDELKNLAEQHPYEGTCREQKLDRERHPNQCAPCDQSAATNIALAIYMVGEPKNK
ncbi:hypothetical protein NECAME_10727 [Necator americanus]|uniref:Mos1 transposase HTH domain-containing protein n=1 Tax=Necator americanus TaxID=51031 RepID=W2T7A7_NECAM|nr:hypothetical protein NECAME_10727 [Necator americanus]ETN77895.1 hypothetical protein NECAME_10727 [Necator americanus]